ncbi:MAG: adenosylcobalamin-dependent ribonucleoside-diphosphate reductase [Phycisphaerales bacterium JB043]
MKITRRFTTAGENPYESVAWTKRASRITNPDGSIVFEMPDAEVPSSWSQLATDIMVSKYFRKAGVPQHDERGEMVRDEGGEVVTGPERSARQVIHRLAGCWRAWGEKHGYFDSAEDAQAFYDELAYMMVHQMSAPNSPQWFNTGLHWAYGLTGPAQGHYVTDPVTGEVGLAKDAYSHPQPHACFIQSVADDLVGDGGIMDLWVREARLFKYGSGTGTNFSGLRGEDESLSGGGKSSGLMSWLKIGDRAAGAIKSGGTTRRAAKMVCLDLDHPDIEDFVNWKVREEIKVAAMVEGLKQLKESDESYKDAAERLGLILDYDFNGESYATVSGQNSNNSVRIPDEFFEALDKGESWELTYRTTREVAKAIDASDLWQQVCYAAWRCADPGVQFDSTINAWHTCPNSGRINASNPCSEYMFLDNTACNLASINLMQFYDSKSRRFDIERFEHAVDIWTIVLEISVLMAAFPSKEIARLSYEYRTLGLGYANLGAMLMQAGIAYDSEEGRAICGVISSVLTGRSYRMSALMAGEHGPFRGFHRNRESMMRVMRNHARAARGVSRQAQGEDGYEQLRVKPVPIDHEVARGVAMTNAEELLERAVVAWDDALAYGEQHGYRNAQVSVIAPTGTIGLLMDCDTTGVEPDFALVKFKKLAGGGYFKIANASIRPALEALGYEEEQIKEILHHVIGRLTLDVQMPDGAGNFREYLRDQGLIDEDLDKLSSALPGVFELKMAFNVWTLGEEALVRLGLSTEEASDPSCDVLAALDLSPRQVRELNEVICGTQTIEGAPHIKDEHLPVFDCANRCGEKGTRFIRPEGHIRMMAAAQPFISGAISKTINLPNEASVEDIASAYRLSWELGLKANALYRDGCKLSQPLSSKSDDSSSDGADEEADMRVLSEDEDDLGVAMAQEEVLDETVQIIEAAGNADATRVEIVRERIVHRPMRRRLPNTRSSVTHKFNIAGHEVYLSVGLYDDGMPGELFITMAKEGSTIGGLMDSLGTAVSVALQYGVPVESLVNKFAHQRFEPGGMTSNRDIPFAKSLVDYIFRWMGMEFLPGYRDANAPQRNQPADDTEEVGQDRVIEERVNHRIGISETGDMEGVVERERDVVAAVVTDDGAQVIAVHEKSRDALSEAMRDCQGDAPACDECGTITVRNGTCYRCMNCGHSMGCS